MKIKQELLEHLIRRCVREVISQVNEIDDIVGAAAPPKDGQSTDVNLPTDPITEPPSEPETPPAQNLKGILLMNPRDKSKLRSLTISGRDKANVERELYRHGSSSGGRNILIARETVNAVLAARNNPNVPLYLYFGKYDPASKEIFLLADKSLELAKANSTDPAEISSGNSEVTDINPVDRPTTSDEEDADYLKNLPKSLGVAGPAVKAPDDDPFGYPEDRLNEVKRLIKKMVNEVLNKK